MKPDTTTASNKARKSSSAILAVVVALSCLSGAYADYVVYYSGSAATTGFHGSTWTPAEYGPSNVDPANYDYIVKGGKTLITSSSEQVGARSLTFGEVGGTKGYFRVYYDTTFTNGLILANGAAWREYGSLITVTAVNGPFQILSPKEAPFVFSDRNYRDSPMRFEGNFIGDETTGIKITQQQLTAGYSFALYMKGSAEDFLGEILVDGTKAVATNSDKTVTLYLEDIAVGGNIVVTDGAYLNVAAGSGSSVKALTLQEGATLQLSAPLTVGDLTLAPDTVISLKYDSSTATCSTFLSVTNSLMRNGTGPITLSLSGTWPSLPPSELIEVAVMSFPEGTDLVAEDFAIDGYSPGTSARTKAVVTMQEDAETHTKRIVLGFYPRILFSGWPTDSASYSEDSSSMMTNGAQWADGLVPHAKAHYQVDRTRNPETGSRGTCYIRTPCYPDGSFEMPAESLYLNDHVHLILMCRDFYLKRLDAVGGNDIFCSYLSDVTFHGELNIGASALNIQTRNDKLFTLDGNLYGTGTVTVSGRARSSNDVRGYFHLAGTNSLYAGRITATLGVDTGGAYPRWAGNRFTSLYVSDARNLGGPLGEFTYNALTLANMSELIASNSVAFTDTTRGLYLKWIAQLTTPSNTTLTLRQPVTFNGCVYKNGMGTLEMGGEVKFIDAEGALTDTPSESATNRTLFVTGGILKPIAARSLDGVDIVFSNKTSKLDVALALDLEPSDLELKTNGLYNVRTSAPIAKSPNLDKVPVYLLSDVEEPAAQYEVGVMTVKEEAADAAFGMLKLVKPKAFDTYGLKTRRVSHPESGTVTLVATLKPGSLYILIR